MGTAIDAYKAVYEQSPADFTPRVRVYAVKAATAVLGEVSPTGVEHDKRVAYARRILDENWEAPSYAMAVATNATIFAAIGTGGVTAAPQVTDSDIEFTVNSLFSDMSGYDPNTT